MTEIIKHRLLSLKRLQLLKSSMRLEGGKLSERVRRSLSDKAFPTLESWVFKHSIEVCLGWQDVQIAADIHISYLTMEFTPRAVKVEVNQFKDASKCKMAKPLT